MQEELAGDARDRDVRAVPERHRHSGLEEERLHRPRERSHRSEAAARPEEEAERDVDLRGACPVERHRDASGAKHLIGWRGIGYEAEHVDGASAVTRDVERYLLERERRWSAAVGEARDERGIGGARREAL